jgi:hypothetical protein
MPAGGKKKIRSEFEEAKCRRIRKNDEIKKGNRC